MALPLLAIGFAATAVIALDVVLGEGAFAVAPLFIAAGLGIYLLDIARMARARVEVLVGEVLGQFPDTADQATVFFELGRRPAFLIDGEMLFYLTSDGKRHHLSAHPGPRELRATRRAQRNLHAGEDAVVVIINNRIIDRLNSLDGRHW